MEISFEKGKFVYCPGGFNYQEVLDDFKRAKKVRIITYNISGTGNTDPLLEQIKKLGEDVDVQIITNIPSRFETYYSSAAGEAMRSRAKHNIEVYLKKLNPESFPTAFSISFNFFNHAKIIGTENIVYIGSANFSNESKQNIETGVIIEDSAFIARLYDEFFEYIKGNSTPYFDDDFNLLRLLTLNLIAKFTVHRAKLSDTLFQRTAYGTYYLPDSPDNVYFSGEDLAILTVGTAAVFVAVKAGLSPHEHFKRTAAAVRKVHCGCTSSQIWAEKNAVDFSQNLRRGRMRKGMLPCGNIPFDAWLFNF